MKTLVKARPYVSDELGQLVQEFHELSTTAVDVRQKHALDKHLEALAYDILLGYRQRALISLKRPIAAAFLKIPRDVRSVPIKEEFGAALVCEEDAQYLVVSGLRDILEDFIDESELQWQRMYRFPY